ncbi:MAG TPA: hypothetical protein VN026_09940 [Bacteroidia bacterium]|jgi:hypothetical protein|nr:hypothetical protein [Bacteroidia bacterium]
MSEFDILVLNKTNFNFVKKKVREMDMEGYEIEYGSNYGLITSATEEFLDNGKRIRQRIFYNVINKGQNYFHLCTSQKASDVIIINPRGRIIFKGF